MTCDKCRFWLPDHIALESGEGRRYAPSATLGFRFDRIMAAILGVKAEETRLAHLEDVLERHAEWSITEADDWCGEFQPKPDTGAAV